MDFCHALGRRIVKDVDNSGDWNEPYHYYYNGQQMVEMRNGSDSVLKQYVWGLTYIDELLQIGINKDPASAHEDNCEQFYWVLQDANFNVLGVLYQDGQMIERYEYTPYGQRTVYSTACFVLGDANGDGVVSADDTASVQANFGSTTSMFGDADCNGVVDADDYASVTANFGRSVGALNDPLMMYPVLDGKPVPAGGVDQAYGLCDVGHQGLFYDKEFGLYENRARMQHPTLGRFLQRDPTGYVDGMSLYEYVRSNPVRYADPTGRITVIIAGKGRSWQSMKNIQGHAMLGVLDCLRSKGYKGIIKSGIYFKGPLTGGYDKVLRGTFEKFKIRKRNNSCSLEQFIAIGHSSGASAIYNELHKGTFKSFMSGKAKVTPAFLGLIDMIMRKDVLKRLPSLIGKVPEGTHISHYKQHLTWSIKGIHNRSIWATHTGIVNHQKTLDWVYFTSKKNYCDHIDREIRQDPRKGKPTNKHW